MYRGDAVETAEGAVGLVMLPGAAETIVMFSPRDIRRVLTCLLRLHG